MVCPVHPKSTIVYHDNRLYDYEILLDQGAATVDTSLLPHEPVTPLYCVAHFEHGALHGTLEFYEDGVLRKRGHMKRGVRDGSWETYGEDGVLLKCVMYDSSGRLEVKKYYEADSYGVGPGYCTTWTQLDKTNPDWFVQSQRRTHPEGFLVEEISVQGSPHKRTLTKRWRVDGTRHMCSEFVFDAGTYYSRWVYYMKDGVTVRKVKEDKPPPPFCDNKDFFSV